MILIIDLNRKQNPLAYYEFIKPLEECTKMIDKIGNKIIIKHYSEIRDEDKDIEKADKIILSGTTLKDNSFIKDIKKFHWIINCNKPILGICAGMEVIALIFKSKINNCQEIGMTEIKTLQKNKLFEGNFEGYELHNFSSIPSPDFLILAKSQNCIQAIKHMQKEIYGLMFHPEVRNEEILRNFVRL